MASLEDVKARRKPYEQMSNANKHVEFTREACRSARIERARRQTPSKLNNERAVPETAATVIIPVDVWVTVAEDMRHATVVPLVHDDVAQSTDATLPVAVRSSEAKASPLRVAVAPPEEGAFRAPALAKLTTGAARVRGTDFRCM